MGVGVWHSKYLKITAGTHEVHHETKSAFLFNGGDLCQISNCFAGMCFLCCSPAQPTRFGLHTAQMLWWSSVEQTASMETLHVPLTLHLELLVCASRKFQHGICQPCFQVEVQSSYLTIRMDCVFLAYFAYMCTSFRRLQPTSDSSLLDLPHFPHSWLPDLHFHSRQQCCKYAAVNITVFLAVTLQFVMLVPILWKNLLGTA